jgi:hypothetical protein
VGATLIASSDGELQIRHGEASSKLGPEFSPLPGNTTSTDTRQENVLGKRHVASSLTAPQSNGPRGLLDQAAEAGRSAAMQIAEEFRSAAERFLEERKARAAETVRGFADALDHAASDLARESPPIADYTGHAARRIEDFANRLQERSWSAILSEAETIAQRQPALFLLGAAGLGFAMGRLLAASPRSGLGTSGATVDPNSPGAAAGAASATTAAGASMTHRRNS